MRIGLFLLIVNLSTAQHRLVHNQNAELHAQYCKISDGASN